MNKWESFVTVELFEKFSYKR